MIRLKKAIRLTRDNMFFKKTDIKMQKCIAYYKILNIRKYK